VSIATQRWVTAGPLKGAGPRPAHDRPCGIVSDCSDPFQTRDEHPGRLRMRVASRTAARSRSTSGVRAVPSDDLIKLTSGEVLSTTRRQYDAARSGTAVEHMKSTGVRPLCHAPFVNLDFSPTGCVTPCNHWHSEGIESDHVSLLEAWRGPRMAGIRRSMLDYTLDRDSCRHCVRQVELRQLSEVFAVRQFDAHPTDAADPAYPKRVIFRLANTCNLACIMCDGDTSSRVRAEFEKRPPLKPVYGERFFDELREILPHLEHVEFYGGEPFLVKEHLRVLDLIAETRARCSIYVNTNATVLTERIRNYLETLNFTTIAISMDSVNPDLHFEVRKGLKGELFARNVEWYLDLAARRQIQLLLNVTEHRKNWFEIPEIFRFAEHRRLYIHVNTCIHPVNVTLYTLPAAQLAYVLDFVEAQRERLMSEHRSFSNVASYDYFVSLIRNELTGRPANWAPPPQPPTALCDGLLGAPIPGKGVCARPDEFLVEVKRAARLDRDTAARFTSGWRSEVAALSHLPGWSRVASALSGEPSTDADRPATPPIRKRFWMSLRRT
jgi:MoaA/NifB/PqqE/SkfB family radical SAM enzyme